MSFLLDTNVVSELRKGTRANPRLRAWFETVDERALWLSVLVIGEIRRGIERLRRRDVETADRLELWLAQLSELHHERILPVTRPIAEVWGRLNVPNPLPVVDGLLAATALVHGLTLVTRNVRDIACAPVSYLDPFA